MSIVIFDLDGTLANIEHRLHFIQSKPKDWPGFFAACCDDKPIWNTIEVAKAMKAAGHELWIFTGRSDEVADETVRWLHSNGIVWDKLLMRMAGDRTPDTEVKRRWLEHYLSGRLGLVLCVFEDRSSVVQMWRDHGLACYQVADGDF